MGLLERLEETLRRTGLSQRALARRAELADERNLGVLLSRLRKNPDAGVELATLRALAKGANAEGPKVSEAWLITGHGSPDDSTDGPRVEREPQPAYGEGEAPFNFNLPNWDALTAAALALEEERAVPACFVEIVGYDNGLLTGPLRPADVLKLARLTAEYRTAGEVEAMLAVLRAKHGRPPLRRGEAVAPKPRAVKPMGAKASGGEE